MEWHGHLSVQPIESDGEFRIDGLRAHTIWEYLEDRLNFAVNSGTIGVDATYNFSLKDAFELQAAVAKAAVNDLAVRPKQSDIDWITVPSLLVSGASVDLAKRQAHLDSLSLTGVKLVTWLEPDGSVNLLKLAQFSCPGVRRPAAIGARRVRQRRRTCAAAPAAAGAPASTAAPWTFDLREFSLSEASISAEDRGTVPAVKVLLAPLSLKAAGVSWICPSRWPESRNSHRRFGFFERDGDVTPQPMSANLALKLKGIELKAAQPYIAQYTSMTLLSGRLNADAKVRYGEKKPALRVAGDISVAGVHTVDNALHDDFINWERLDVSGVTFQHDPDDLDIERVTARKLYARVIIEPDASLNVKRVLAGPGATVVAQVVPRGAPVAATAAVRPNPPPRKSMRQRYLREGRPQHRRREAAHAHGGQENRSACEPG